MQHLEPPSTRRPIKPAAHAVRNYLFKVDPRCNAGKLAQLCDMHEEWTRLLPLVGDHLWSKFLAGEVSAKSLSSAVGPDSVFGDSRLQANIKQCMAVAIEGQIKTWRANLKRRIARLVMRNERYSADEALRHQLLWLNSMQLWLAPFDKQLEVLQQGSARTKVKFLEPHSSRLMARYVRAYIHRFKPPRFEQLPLQVNQGSSVWAPARDTGMPGVVAWLRISTLVRGERIELPLRANAYAARFQGEQALTFSFLPRGKQWYVKVCKKLERAQARPADGPVLGLDLGLTNMLATSQGAIYGQGFNLKLRRRDEQLQRITKGLQGAAEYRLGRSKRYRNFTRRMRGWLTSEIRSAVNRALLLGQPSTVVIEALSFSSEPGTLSRRMNRLVRRMGAGIVKEALTQKSELQGFKLVEVNPAYTSQECGSCGFIGRANRKGNRFKCVCCGKQAHADAQAARNLVERFREGRTCEYVKHTTLGMQGLQRWGTRMRTRLERATPGTSRHRGVIGDVRVGLRELKGRGSHLDPIIHMQRLLSEMSFKSSSACASSPHDIPNSRKEQHAVHRQYMSLISTKGVKCRLSGWRT